MNRYGNVFAVTDAACDLCDRTLRLALVDDKPREGEVTPASKTTICPHCDTEVPVRISGHPPKPEA